jgi:glyoxylase-like metal-dependent hydrolase (beta-lactamase superfamily II)
MKVTPVTENLRQLTRLRFVNAYLVREDDGFTLVDTMLGGSADGVIEAARTAGGEIRRIALTHGHGDHVGSLDALKQRLGDAVEVLMPDLDARIHAGETVVEGKPAGSWPKLQTVPDVRLVPGQRVGSLEVVPSPGHTPGHVAFLDVRDRMLIAGDAFTNIGRVNVSSQVYWRFPLATVGTWNRPEALRSAGRLRELEPSGVVFGHGAPLRTPEPALEQAIARASR